MKFDIKNLINGLMKVVLLLAFFCSGYWTKSIIDEQQITANKNQIEWLQVETERQRKEIDELKVKATNIDLILQKISRLEAMHDR